MLKTLTIVLFTVFTVQADVEAVRSERNPERRSVLALDEVDLQLTAARQAYTAGDLGSFRKSMDTAGELAELSYKSLQDTGKQARKSPKWFKRAEQKLLVVLRNVDSLAKDVTVDDKDQVEALRKRVRDVHEQILQDIMSKK